LPRTTKLKNNKNNILSVEKTSHIHILFLRLFNNLLFLSLSFGNWSTSGLSRSRLSRRQSLGQLLEFVIGGNTNGHEILEGALDHVWNGDLVWKAGSKRQGSESLGSGPD
jgi:hypothetical protein